MEAIVSSHILKVIAGVVIGGALGYLYYRFVGCASGACPITSNKYSATLYGALMGLILTMK
jgi:F0F1-type ATP synthase assembly protein I